MMTLKEWLDREPTGMAFCDMVDWLKYTNTVPSVALIKSQMVEYIVKHGGNHIGIIKSGFDYSISKGGKK